MENFLLYSRSIDEHIQRLEVILSRLRQHNLKLEPSKCMLFRKSVKFLGHVLSADGVKTDADKIRAVQDWPRPQGLKELRRFNGFISYYRRLLKTLL